MTSDLSRHLLSTTYGPSDRLLEIAILLLILYKIIEGIGRNRRERKRRELLEKKRSWLSQFVLYGEKLRHDTPRDGAEVAVEARSEWIELVEAWNTWIAESLTAEFPKAAVTFNMVRTPGVSEAIVFPPNIAGSPYCVSGSVRVAYLRLVAQLGNLTEIMEKAEIYF